MLIMKKILFQVLPDEVDVIFKVEEQFSGSIGGSIGYGAYVLI